MILLTVLMLMLIRTDADNASYSNKIMDNGFESYNNLWLDNISRHHKVSKFDEIYLRSGILFWDFEGSHGGFNPTPASDAWQWGRLPWTTAYSGIKAWGTYTSLFPWYYENDADWRLESPYIVLDSVGACTLSFYHWYTIEYFFDGGNLKVSADSGITWSIISPFEPQNYPCDSTSMGNQGIPGEPCFSGDSSGLGWHQAKFLLDSYAGRQIMIRWHFGSDGALKYPGWYIDDVRITSVKSTGGITHDAGPTAIILPDTNILPYLTINVTCAKARNAVII